MKLTDRPAAGGLLARLSLAVVALGLCGAPAMAAADAPAAPAAKPAASAPPAPAAKPAVSAPAAPVAKPAASTPTAPSPVAKGAINAPSDPLAKAAFEVLQHNCARCHEADQLVERKRPAGKFGNILHLDEIARNPKLIRPGLPQASFLFKQIVDQEMPYDVMVEGKDGPSPSEADIKTLEKWIVSLKAGSCDAHKFVSNEQIIQLIAADLEKLTSVRAKGTRYLTLTHLSNACAGDEAMNVYRQGAIKLINSLSRSSDVDAA